MLCLPKDLTQKFLQKLKDGTIDPQKLNDMSPEDRHAFFADMLGEDTGTAVNALFESKLQLKNQQAGYISWAKEVGGLKPEVMKDFLSKVNKLQDALNPADEKAFLKDYVAKKVGTEVSSDEAKNISQMAKEASDAKINIKDTPGFSKERNAYGNKYLKLLDYVDSLKPKGSPFTFSNIINFPKSALTSIFHFSASFVQGWGMMTTGRFWEGFKNQFSYFASSKAYQDLNADIIAHPDYPLAKDGRLGLTALGDKLSTREEAIQSSLLEHVPGLNKLVNASSRGFTGMLNYVRFTRFVDLLNSARLNDENVMKGSSVVSDIAKTVNDFTGRGALGAKDRYASVQPLLNTVMFSPRKIAATIEMFDPIRYLDPKISPTARMGALRQLSGSLIATGAILTLAQMAGASVNLNPTSTNFAKVKIGNTTLDMTGGNAIYIRLLARLFTGTSISGTGKETSLTSGKFASQTRADLVISFLRDKLAPTASAVADFLYGKDPVGQPFSVSSEMYDKLTPIVMQDFINLVKNDPNDSAVWLPSLSAIFGVSMESNKK